MRRHCRCVVTLSALSIIRKLGSLTRPSGGDLLAGASVAMVGIPQALAYAELAGMPPQYGLLALALPTLLAAAFVSSHYLQTGPIALIALLVFGTLSPVAEPGTVGYIERAALLALLVGLIQAFLGLVRFGRSVYLMSEPVITGFTAGAAILIIASQLPKAVDMAVDGRGVLANAVAALTHPDEWNWSALGFTAGTVTLMLVGSRIHKLFPDVLVVVIAGVLLAKLGYSGPTVGRVEGGVFDLSLSLPWSSTPGLLVPAAVIALAGFAESASIARRFAAEDRLHWNADREMISQGVANLVSGAVGTFPVGGSFSRSTLNRSAGATSAWAGAVTGALVLAVLPLMPLIEGLPLAVLGAIVIVVVARLVDLRTLWRLSYRSFPQAVVGIGTLAATLAMSPRVERGVLVGLVLSIAVHLYRELNVTFASELVGTELTVRPNGVLWFATVSFVERLIREEIARHRDIETVVIDLGGVGRIDYSGAAGLNRVLSERVAPTVRVKVTGVPESASRAVRAELRDYRDCECEA